MFRTSEDEIGTLVAAFNFLPLWSVRGSSISVPEDNTPELVTKYRLNAATMRVLDAFAAACVCQPQDAYAVTYEVKDSRVRLYVASSSPDEVSADVHSHLKGIWSTMQSLAAHPDSLHRRQTYFVTDALEVLHSNFICLLYRFSWAALAHRFESVADAAILCLGQVLRGSPELEANASLFRCPADLTDRERKYFADLRSALAKARQAVLDEGLETHGRGIHAVLGVLHALLNQWGAGAKLQHLDALAGTALSRDVRSLVWLSEPVDMLHSYAHSAAFDDLRELDFEIVAIPSARVTRRFDFSSKYLAETVRAVYTDVRIVGPEPNFESEFTTYVLDPARQHFAGAEHGAFAREVYPHAECVLIEHFLRNLLNAPDLVTTPRSQWPLPFVRYIGTSEPTCLPCYRFIQAVCDLFRLSAMHVRGSDGHIPLCWTPGVRGVNAVPLRTTLHDLNTHFQASLSILRTRLAEKRQADRLSRGESPLRPEEQTYRDDATTFATRRPFRIRIEY